MALVFFLVDGISLRGLPFSEVQVYVLMIIKMPFDFVGFVAKDLA